MADTEFVSGKIKQRYSLAVVNGKLSVTDNFPQLQASDSDFWDSIVRLRVGQLDAGDDPLIKMSLGDNNYHIAISELSQKGVLFGNKLLRKELSQKAHFELSNDGTNLVVDQLDGPAFYKDTIRNNRFFCASLLARRTRQLDSGAYPILKYEIYSDGDEDEIHIVGHPDIEPIQIAKLEIGKGIILNGQFVSAREMNCG